MREKRAGGDFNSYYAACARGTKSRGKKRREGCGNASTAGDKQLSGFAAGKMKYTAS
jgi:hypothetical protein